MSSVTREMPAALAAVMALTPSVQDMTKEDLSAAALVDDGEHAPFFMLCAVVYGAVNAHLGAVTDDHERAFLARLIEHARSAR